MQPGIGEAECEAGASSIDLPVLQEPPATTEQWQSVAPRLIPEGPVRSSKPSVLQVSPQPAPRTSYTSRNSHGSLQIIGRSAATGLLSFSFVHSVECGDQQQMRLRQRPNGAYLDLSNGSDAPLVYELASPWAVDATGRELPTWFEFEGTTLRQVVDATAATAPVLFDPTYSTVSCSGHYSDRTAGVYMNTSTADRADCPVLGMLRAVRRYTPVWGFEDNVANEYGKLMIKQSGECSGLSDTGPSYDFQVPCKAHDYCYDLRRAGFTGTVTDEACDEWLYSFMEAHCNDRGTQFGKADCRVHRDGVYLVVRFPTVVSHAEPGLVTIRNYQTDKCADVERASRNQGALVQQYSCVGVTNQQFRIFPVEGHAPYFYIRAEHSDQCMGVRATEIYISQENCFPFEQLQMRILSARNEDAYSIRPRTSLSGSTRDCWHVPFNSFDNEVKLDHPFCDDSSNWYVWRIIDVA